MKKLLIGLFIFGFIAISAPQVHASLYSDALLKIQNLTKEISQLKIKLKASVLGSSSDSQTIILKTGWNIISFNVNPSDLSLNSVFASMNPDNGEIITNEDAVTATYMNGSWSGGFTTIDTSKAYKIKVSRDKTLTVDGNLISVNSSIPLRSGTNLVPYYPTVETDVVKVFSSIQTTCLKKVMDGWGKTYENFGAFGGWKNSIGTLKPGEGYTVFTTGSCILNYGDVNKTPSITVLSPNGGENFKLLDVINVKWNYNGIATPTDIVKIILKDTSNNKIYTMCESCENSGLANVGIPHGWGLAGGNIYKISARVTDSTGFVSQDDSDNTFTINSTNTNTCSLSATVVDTYLSTDKTGWGFHIIINANNKPTNSNGWATNFEGYTPSVTAYGVNKTYGNFFTSSGPLSLTATDQIDSNCKVTTTINPPSTNTTPTLKVSLDSSTPSIQTITAGAGNVVFAKIKISAGSKDVNNLKAIQIASNLPSAIKLNNLAVYDGETKIGSTNNGLTYNGSYYQSWVYLNNKLSIPANTSKVLSIMADTSPVGFTNAFSLDIRLGIAGWTFDYPGARVDPFGTAIYGNTITITSSSVDTGCSNEAIFSSITGQRCSTINTPWITILSPNGKEIFKVGDTINVKWIGTLTAPDTLNAYLVAGHEEVPLLMDSIPVSSGGITWTNPGGVIDWKIPASVMSSGGYYIEIRTKSFTADSKQFTITSSSTDTGCSNGAIYSNTTGQRCSVIVDNGCNGTRYSTTTGQLCGTTGTTTTNPIKITRTLSLGMRGKDVIVLQSYLGLPMDGVFGKYTRIKVMQWQLNNGIIADGVFGLASRLKAGLNQ
ncbi:MAG: hypothetical protein WC241_00265 [Candidatus Paceibacterota bacterium]|jgi:hypothetical protein